MQTKSCNWFTANPDAFARRSAGGLHVRDRLPHVRAALPVATTSAPGLSDPSDGDPLITVLLPHYGCESYLSMAVASILSQTLTRFVLYIIDDCSPTGDWLTAVRPHLGDSRGEAVQDHEERRSLSHRQRTGAVNHLSVRGVPGRRRPLTSAASPNGVSS